MGLMQMQADEHFVSQAGHEFFLVCSPWICSGHNDIFKNEIDKDYNTAERFENDKTKSQGQLKEIPDLLQVRFPLQALQQRCFDDRSFLLQWFSKGWHCWI